MSGRAFLASLDRPVLVVVGKGGVGKSTAACALALAFADAGEPTHLISTDPAHSLADILCERSGAAAGAAVRSECSPRLVVEEFDAAAYAGAWFAAARAPLHELIDRGTYLDADLASELLDLAEPGFDEWMAALRVEELAAAPGRVVVDTAPAGHALRMLDAAPAIAGWIAALRATADKAVAVGTGVLGRPVRLRGQDVLDALEARTRRYDHVIRNRAEIVVATRADPIVVTETRRLAGALEGRGLHVAATLVAGGAERASPGDSAAGRVVGVPWIERPTGCEGLRAWAAAVVERRHEIAVAGAVANDMATEVPPAVAGPARAWLGALPQRRLLFVGKGGVGKTTCAAAAAVAIAGDRPTRLLGLDPRSALHDVLARGPLGDPPDGARAKPSGAARDALSMPEVAVLDPDTEIAGLRDRYSASIEALLARLGVGGSAELDRRVLERLWETAPPGIDELAALVRLAEHDADDATLVIDAAPTGHLLRLLELPALATLWIRTIVRGIARSGAASSAEAGAHALIRFAGRLRRLMESLRDPGRTATFIVTLDEPVVRAETDRLRDRLRRGNVPVVAVVVNRAPGAVETPSLRSASDRSRRGAPHGRLADDGVALFHAPELRPAPAGPVGLLQFLDAWRMQA